MTKYAEIIKKQNRERMINLIIRSAFFSIKKKHYTINTTNKNNSQYCENCPFKK